MFKNLLRAVFWITSDERFGFTEREEPRSREENVFREMTVFSAVFLRPVFLYNYVKHCISVPWRNRN